MKAGLSHLFLLSISCDRMLLIVGYEDNLAYHEIVSWKKEDLVDPWGVSGSQRSSDHTLVNCWSQVTISHRAVFPYLALYFHPRTLVSVLLQSEGTHQELEVNPSFPLHNGTKQRHTHRLFQVYPQPPSSPPLAF